MNKVFAALLALMTFACLVSSREAVAQVAVVVTTCPPTRATPYPAGTQALLTVDQNGILCTNATGGGGGGGTSSNFNATFPTAGTAVGMSQGGNMVALTGTSNNLNVQCANCSGSGVSTVDEAAYTAGSSLFAGGGGFFQTTATNGQLTSGQQGLFQLTATRALFTNLRNAAGTEIGTAATPVQVSLANTGANGTALLVTGTGGTFPVTGTVTANAGTNLNTSALALETGGNLAQVVTDFGAPGATACATDTASCSNNQLMQRLAQRLTTINTTLGTPFQAAASIGNTTFAVTQATAASLNATVVGTGTFVTQSTLAAETTKVIGTVRNLGNAGAITDFAGQNASSPANAWLIGGQFQTTPTTITPGNASPLQLDNAGNLLVNVKTALGLTQGSTTSGQTGSLIMGATTAANPTYTTAQTNYLSTDVKGNLRAVLGGGIPETASATGTTGATTATLATAAATTTYLCGFSIRANAAAAATGNATVTGTITGTLNFTQWTAVNTSGVGVTEEIFTPCIPASAVNTTIAVVSAAPGTSGIVSVTAWGYQQ